MKRSFVTEKERGLTLVELVVVLAAIAVLACIFIPPAVTHKARALRIQCANNLKVAGLAFRVWAPAQDDAFPMRVSVTNGGTMEFSSGPNAFRHFQIMSNELTPIVLVCPADPERIQANTFGMNASSFAIPFASNSNLSYFVSLDAAENDPQRILSGDRNLTNGTPLKNGVLELTPGHPEGWTDEIHRQMGNILLADGSVQLETSIGLHNALTNAPAFTNRMLMPVLGP